MNKLTLLFVLLALFSFRTSDTTLSDKERKFATDLLTQSREHLLTSTRGLTEAQLNFKPDPESWSVAECAEHLALSETIIFSILEQALQGEPDPARREEVKIADDQIVGMITDRSNKVKTREPFEPRGNYGSHEATVKEFTTKRDEHIQYIKTTNDDLRNRYATFPFGTLDAYQVVLFMAGHTERHSRQIDEVKSHPDFPAKK